MLNALLSTKLYVPAPRPQNVPRPHLVQKINTGLHSGRRLTLLSAPAGFGKTSLVSEWLASSSLLAAWLALDEGDNDPHRFWRYVTAALQTLQPNLGQGLALGLQAPHPPTLTALITSLINDLNGLPHPLVLVLDDYHLLENGQIHESLNFFIDHLPACVHMVIITRSDPPLQLSRRRGRGELIEVRAADLRFNREETARFLNEVMQLDLSSGEIQSLEQRTEGWVTGLQMAGLSLAGVADKPGFVRAFSGDDRYVADYLIEEVLAHQSAPIQQFLFKTSALERLSAPLCDFLMDVDNSQAILNDLERANLFIFPLDNRRQWFRYHPLFANLLRQRLQQNSGKEALNDLRLKASTWFEHNEQIVEAIEMSLAAHSIERTADLLDKYAGLLFFIGDLVALLKWGSLLPDAALKARPALIMALGWAASATGQPALAGVYAKMIQEKFNLSLDDFLSMEDISTLEPLTRSALIETTVLCSRLAVDQFDVERLRRMANRVLPYLTPERDSQPHLFNTPSNLRPPLVYFLGWLNLIGGDLKQAAHMLSDAAESALQQDNIHIVALALGQLGQVYTLQGQLHQAEEQFNQAVATSQAHPELRTPYFSQAWLGLASLAYEHNDLVRAETCAQKALELGMMWQSSEQLYPIYLLLMRLCVVNKDWAKLETLRQCVLQMPAEFLRTVNTSLACFLAWIADRQGQSEALRHWAETYQLADNTILFIQEIEETLPARSLLLAGKLEETARLLDKHLANLKASQSQGRLMDWMVIQAMLHLAQDRPDDAQATLLEVLPLAQPQGYLRLFVDEGQPMHHLLEKMTPGLPPPLKKYVKNILSAFSNDIPMAQNHAQDSLIEPLSEREIEVLTLMVGGISNADMAARLYVTVNTVKKHITNIFNKLAVENRLQAVEKGRQLGIIPK